MDIVKGRVIVGSGAVAVVFVRAENNPRQYYRRRAKGDPTITLIYDPATQTMRVSGNTTRYKIFMGKIGLFWDGAEWARASVTPGEFSGKFLPLFSKKFAVRKEDVNVYRIYPPGTLPPDKQAVAPSPMGTVKVVQTTTDREKVELPTLTRKTPPWDRNGKGYIDWGSSEVGQYVKLIDDSASRLVNLPLGKIYRIKAKESADLDLIYVDTYGNVRTATVNYSLLIPVSQSEIPAEVQEERPEVQEGQFRRGDFKTELQKNIVITAEDAERELQKVFSGVKPIFEVNNAMKAKLMAILNRLNRIVATSEQKDKKFTDKGKEKPFLTIDVGMNITQFGCYIEELNTIALNLENIFKYADTLKEFIGIVRGVNWHEMGHYLFTIPNWKLPEVKSEGLHDYINVLSDCRDESALVSYADNPYIRTWLRITVQRIIIRQAELAGTVDTLGYALVYGRRLYMPYNIVQDFRKLCNEKNGAAFTKKIEEIVDGYLFCDGIKDSVEWARKLKALIPDENAIKAVSTNDGDKIGDKGGRAGSGRVGSVSKRISKAVEDSDDQQEADARVTLEQVISDIDATQRKIDYANKLIAEKGEPEAAKIIAAMGW